MNTHQSGFAVRFVIIGLLLVVVTVGVAYAFEKRGESVRQSTAIAVASKETSKTDVAPPVTVTRSSNQISTASASPTPTGVTSTTLPVTGPQLNVVSILPLAFIVMSITAFVVSITRRRSPQLL